MKKKTHTMEEDKDENGKGGNNQFDESVIWVILGMLLAAVVIGIVYWINFIKTPQTKVSKSYIRKKYGVNKVTFNKWIQYFCTEVYPDFEEYKKLRKIPMEKLDLIFETLGKPDLTSPRIFKKDLAKRCNTSLRDLKANVEMSPEDHGISYEHYCNLSVFPPKVADKIVIGFMPD